MCFLHGWIFRVLDKAGLPALLQSFPQMISKDSTTALDCAGQVKGHFAVATGVWKGYAPVAFFFMKAFDTIFRWLHNTVIPKDLPAWLQLTPCADIDDVAVAAPSFQTLMLFQVIDMVISTNLNYERCYLVQHGHEACDTLRVNGSLKTVLIFGDLKITWVAEGVGAMIGLEGCLPRIKFVKVCSRIVTLRRAWSSVWWTRKSMRCPFEASWAP